MARILLGVSGGISAYKAVELTRLAGKAGHSVRVVQTERSLEFVGRATFEGITGAPVLVDEFEKDPARGAFPGDPAPDHDPISHLEVVRRADVYVIAPGSANTIAKLAHGLADNLLTSAALAATCQVVVAPAMNNAMYENAATQANLEVLRARGVHIIEPGVGSLASRGEWGVGRLADPAEILAELERILGGGFTPHSLDGLRVLVTAGGTREPIDSVRYVGNRSSGRMGVAIAAAALSRGASVTLISANVSVPLPEGIEEVRVETAAELEAAARAAFAAADVVVMAAAVADFRPASAVDDKIKKSGRDRLALELEPTTDVLAALAAERRPESRGPQRPRDEPRGTRRKGLRPLQARQRPARERRFLRRGDPAGAGPQARAGEELDPRGAGPRLLPLGPLSRCIGRVRGGRGEVPRKRLRALLPGPSPRKERPRQGSPQAPGPGRLTA